MVSADVKVTVWVLIPADFQCWARATFFLSRHRDVRHFLNLCTTEPIFQHTFSRHRISATAPLNFSATAQHFWGKTRAI